MEDDISIRDRLIYIFEEFFGWILMGAGIGFGFGGVIAWLLYLNNYL